MKKFMTIWAGELISNIGSGMTAFALSVYVYQLTGSAGYVSLVTLLAYMPAILLGPIGGLLADRYDRRLMMILGDLFSGLGLFYMLVQIILEISAVMCGVFVAFTGMKNHVVWVTVMLFLFFAALPFMNTCADVLVRISIPNELQGRVWGLISLLSQVGTILAYATCGVLADHIFEPMFQEEGILAGNIGRLIGIGTGRGIGFMLILSGIGIVLAAVLIGGNPSIRVIEKGGAEDVF